MDVVNVKLTFDKDTRFLFQAVWAGQRKETLSETVEFSGTYSKHLFTTSRSGSTLFFPHNFLYNNKKKREEEKENKEEGGTCKTLHDEREDILMTLIGSS